MEEILHPLTHGQCHNFMHYGTHAVGTAPRACPPTSMLARYDWRWSVGARFFPLRRPFPTLNLGGTGGHPPLSPNTAACDRHGWGAVVCAAPRHLHPLVVPHPADSILGPGKAWAHPAVGAIFQPLLGALRCHAVSAKGWN